VGEKTTNEDAGSRPRKRHQGSYPTNSDRVKIEARVSQALPMVLEGKTPAEIAAALGVDRSTVSRYIKGAYERLAAENTATAEEIRAMLTERVNSMYADFQRIMVKIDRALDAAESGEEAAMLAQALAAKGRNLLGAIERLAKMHGIDSTNQNVTVDINVQITGMIGHLHAAGMETIEELRALGKSPEMIEAAAEALDMARQKTAAKIEAVK
jgi:predicted transcriptional regulator